MLCDINRLLAPRMLPYQAATAYFVFDSPCIQQAGCDCLYRVLLGRYTPLLRGLPALAPNPDSSVADYRAKCPKAP